MFCRYCGMQNYDNAAFCNYCGTPFTEMRPKKSKALPMILISCAIVVIITAIIIICISSGSRQSSTATSHGFRTPEDAALNWLEGVYNNNYDLVVQTIYPDMIHDNIQRDIYKFQPSYI
ncbi:MAG: zinc-ribbon domain-containing protein [Ruminococcaceae bacterium]|nr:zinc-ribbon domain-containing protein [Oscillospiraceae bacterium]